MQKVVALSSKVYAVAMPFSSDNAIYQGTHFETCDVFTRIQSGFDYEPSPVVLLCTDLVLVADGVDSSTL